MERNLDLALPRAADAAASRRAFLLGDARTKYGLYAICLGFALVLLDTTALNVAVESIQRDLGGSLGGLQWVVNSYTIVLASCLLTAGALCDRLGARRFYQVGLLLFVGMSALCGLSPGVGFLIGARALQGLGAAIMLPASLALLSHEFPDTDDRARAVAFWASIVSLAFAVGPVLGGALTSAFGWRSIFFLNVPLGLLALFLIQRFVAASPAARGRQIDIAGQAAISLALVGLTFGLIEAGSMGWAAPRVIVAFALAVAGALAFLRIERTSAAPTFPRTLMASPIFTVCVGIGAVLNFGMYGVLFIESVYLQSVRHLSVLDAGLAILPFTLTPTITTRLIVRYSGREYLRRRLVVGHAVTVGGAGLLALSLTNPGIGLILLGLGLLGVGMGCIMPAMTAGVLTASSAQDAGVASGILNAARQVGGTLGVALMGALVQRFPEAGYRGSFLLTAASYLVMGVFTGRLLTDSPGRSPDSGSRRGLPESGTTRLKNGTSRGG